MAYLEGLTIEEATNELAFIATVCTASRSRDRTGAAAPGRAVEIRFQEHKSLISFTFTDTQPVSYWEKVAKREYGTGECEPESRSSRWSPGNERALAWPEARADIASNGYADKSLAIPAWRRNSVTGFSARAVSYRNLNVVLQISGPV